MRIADSNKSSKGTRMASCLSDGSSGSNEDHAPLMFFWSMFEYYLFDCSLVCMQEVSSEFPSIPWEREMWVRWNDCLPSFALDLVLVASASRSWLQQVYTQLDKISTPQFSVFLALDNRTSNGERSELELCSSSWFRAGSLVNNST